MAGTSADSEEILRVEVKPNATIYKPKAIDISTSTLKQYVGAYDIQGTSIKVHTKENDTKLYLFIPDNPEFKFIATGKHKFSAEKIAGFELEFKNLENGIFKELLIIQPDGAPIVATRK